jgi:REP element-mobilizing transposase RayT
MLVSITSYKGGFSMSRVFFDIYFHCVFSTKNREPLLTREVRSRLFPYIVRVAENKGFTAVSVGGVEDHLHALLSLPPKIPVSNAIKLVKGNSSRWINQSFDLEGAFAWQSGYAAFSIGTSQLRRTKNYINKQEKHHRCMTFDNELNAFLRKNAASLESALADDRTVDHDFNHGTPETRKKSDRTLYLPDAIDSIENSQQ